jgi:hypothetical protein
VKVNGVEEREEELALLASAPVPKSSAGAQCFQENVRAVYQILIMA